MTTPSASRLKVGVTTPGTLPQGDAALWVNGVHQNTLYLALLLQKLPGVDWAGLISCPDNAAACPLAQPFGLPAMDEADAVERLDVIIELGARGGDAGMRRFRERGGRLVSYMAGNVMVMNFEALACGVPHGEILSGAGFDAVWITPQHWWMNRGYAAMTRSERVQMAPHIWSPVCLERSQSALGTDMRWRPPPADRWRLGVFDPTVNVVKTFHLPMMACEEAYRRSPDLVDRVLMFGAAGFIGVRHFDEICAAMTLARDGRLFAEARFPLAEVLGVHVDGVVTHQWENELNYLYWDVLHAGRPLIHNSPALGEAGYAYPGFDPQAGGEALVRAMKTHHLGDARRQAAEQEILWRCSIDNPMVQAAYRALLEEVMS